jgi:hypothetical protein
MPWLMMWLLQPWIFHCASCNDEPIASDTNLVVDCISWEGERVEACRLQKSRSNRRQKAWVELGLAMKEIYSEKSNCGERLLPFCMIAWRSKGSGHCCDTQTTEMHEVKLGSRWGQLSHKRKCYSLPDVTSLHRNQWRAGICAVEIKEVQVPTLFGGDFEMNRNDYGWYLLDFLPLFS